MVCRGLEAPCYSRAGGGMWVRAKTRVMLLVHEPWLEGGWGSLIDGRSLLIS